MLEWVGFGCPRGLRAMRRIQPASGTNNSYHWPGAFSKRTTSIQLPNHRSCGGFYKTPRQTESPSGLLPIIGRGLAGGLAKHAREVLHIMETGLGGNLFGRKIGGCQQVLGALDLHTTDFL